MGDMLQVLTTALYMHHNLNVKKTNAVNNTPGRGNKLCSQVKVAVKWDKRKGSGSALIGVPGKSKQTVES